MASCRRAGTCCGPGRLRPSAPSTRAWIVPIQAAKSASVALASIGCAREGLENFALQHPDLLLRGLKALAALLGQLEAPLVRGQRLLERQAAVFHPGDDAFEFRQGLLEGRFGGFRLLTHGE